MTVLVVEDDPDIREYMRVFLEHVDHPTIVEAANGREALAQCRATPVDLILLDVHMPVMDGFAFRAAQLDDPSLAAIPVICLTAHYDPHGAGLQLQAPCFGKPLNALAEAAIRTAVTLPAAPS